jgi:hypothetical protein
MKIAFDQAAWRRERLQVMAWSPHACLDRAGTFSFSGIA